MERDRDNEEMKNIVDELIKKSFPELLNEDIRIEYKNLSDGFLELDVLSPEGYLIGWIMSLKIPPERLRLEA